MSFVEFHHCTMLQLITSIFRVNIVFHCIKRHFLISRIVGHKLSVSSAGHVAVQQQTTALL